MNEGCVFSIERLFAPFVNSGFPDVLGIMITQCAITAAKYLYT